MSVTLSRRAHRLANLEPLELRMIQIAACCPLPDYALPGMPLIGPRFKRQEGETVQPWHLDRV